MLKKGSCHFAPFHWTDLKPLVCSSGEPDAKRQRAEENSTTGTAGQDLTANPAYNYNSWYQVRLAP